MQLWGEKTNAWFDIWSVEHLIAGMTLGSLWLWLGRRQQLETVPAPLQMQLYVLQILGVAYAWEAFEFYLEAGYIWDRATYWLQGIEFMGNRLVTDPLLVLAGALLVRKKEWLHRFSRIFSIFWVIAHIFIFSHCMVLQDWLTRKITGYRRPAPSYEEWLAQKPDKPPYTAGGPEFR